jgi:hypothetical protein
MADTAPAERGERALNHQQPVEVDRGAAVGQALRDQGDGDAPPPVIVEGES